MMRLEDNVFNRERREDQPKFKLWKSAGLLLTYGCPSRCACCYVYSGPTAADPATEMSVKLALGCWRGIRRLAGPDGRIHLTGGEPFLDYERLERILEAAQREGLGGLEKIETNAFWCMEEQSVRERLGRLRERGLTRLQISTDIYHQQYVPIERVRLGVRVAEEVLGKEGVQVRWRDFLSEPVMVGPMNDSERLLSFRETLEHRGERLLGRAAEKLATLLPLRSYEYFSDINCVRNLLGARHVHIDGGGNVFAGTCIGILVGRVLLDGDSSLEGLWGRFDCRKHPIMSILVEQGPAGLMALAGPKGYRLLPGYAGKCHLCYEIRRFLYRCGCYSEFLGPSVCYGLGL